MVKKRKLPLVLFLLTLILILYSCCKTIFWTGSYEFNHTTDDWAEVKIEIVQIDGYIDDTHFTNTPYQDSYNQEKIMVIREITDKESFIQELQSLTSYQPLGQPIGSIHGNAIRLIYSDGQIEIITHYGSALIKESEILVYTKTFDKNQFQAFWQKWAAET